MEEETSQQSTIDTITQTSVDSQKIANELSLKPIQQDAGTDNTLHGEEQTKIDGDAEEKKSEATEKPKSNFCSKCGQLKEGHSCPYVVFTKYDNDVLQDVSSDDEDYVSEGIIICFVALQLRTVQTKKKMMKKKLMKGKLKRCCKMRSLSTISCWPTAVHEAPFTLINTLKQYNPLALGW